MKKMIAVCTLSMMASFASYAQTSPPRSPTAQTLSPPVRQDMHGFTDGAANQQQREVADRNHRDYLMSEANLAKLRDQLAEGWQSFGMTKESALEVAAAYQPNGKSALPQISLKGKSDQEVAAMLQSALAKKDFMMANQTLIEFERKQVSEKN